MKVGQIIEKFRLKDDCLVGGVVCHKMEDACIHRFIDGDPSGHGKYLLWMLYQAGGGKERLERSSAQWSKGEHGEPPLRDMVKFHWVKSRVRGFTDDTTGEVYPPVSESEADKAWKEEEPILRDDYVYGDQDHQAEGGFGFFQTWDSSGGAYQRIVDLVGRFHKHRQALGAKGVKMDLTMDNYPHVDDLAEALKEVTAHELRTRLDHDVVYHNAYIQVVCPYTIGSSLLYGINKWCTSNDSEMMRSLTGKTKNRWAEYAGVSALYYCRFKNIWGDSSSVAVQIMLVGAGTPTLEPGDVLPDGHLTRKGEESVSTWEVTHATYWDAEDKSHKLHEFLDRLTLNATATREHLSSFREALEAIAKHYRTFDYRRVVTNWCI